ncbi:hypothetical protein SAMN05660649_04744 [Desulfotomaculum arcticum]|uniref:DUF2325 domain-containing protein n=1 Tax=Desulfotruncus arcticus DSM 17038 TaxID=1121424 RepID=A0A1I2Z472_9FIRM|nr:DUF2325 domain-containing protein [Desulfotruncus arcticus]SFH32286.1 hypothetical protein SAMN05660649_04744 [Desulfotomaculum arcticum] [Desulfotruncus arcticus DSM 17038]
MPDKAFEKVLQFLNDLKDLDQNAYAELQKLHEALRSSRKAYMEIVHRQQEIDTGEQDREVEEADEDSLTGDLRRLPKGAVIELDNGTEIFVPEIWVRNLGLEHGDVVAATPLGMLDRSPLYEFSVLERRGLGATSDRVSITGPVVFHGGEWFIYSDEEESLISLKPKEVRGLDLREGDIVEVAYPAGDISAARVAWKYEDVEHEPEYRTSRVTRRQPKKEKVADIGDPVLSGKTVLVVGGDLYRESYKLNFERRGVNFTWESGFQGSQGKNIEAKVRMADVIVLVTGMMSHRLPDVEAMCRRYGKPYVYAPSKGFTGAVRACQKVFLK